MIFSTFLNLSVRNGTLDFINVVSEIDLLMQCKSDIRIIE